MRGRDQHKKPPSHERDGGARCTPRGATLVGGGFRRPPTPSVRAKGGSPPPTDTPLPVTGEKPVPSTEFGSAEPFGARLPEPFGTRSALGFHRPQLARPRVPVPTRSDRRRWRSSVGRDSINPCRVCQAGGRPRLDASEAGKGSGSPFDPFRGGDPRPGVPPRADTATASGSRPVVAGQRGNGVFPRGGVFMGCRRRNPRRSSDGTCPTR